MKFKTLRAVFTLLLLLVMGVMIVGFALRTGIASVSAAPVKHGELLVTKECSAYYGQAGEFCTITSSTLWQIKVGSTLYYDQAANVPAGFLDSNVLLDARDGNWAMGRCTLDLATGSGLCTFSDGTGELAGFNARVGVSPPTDGVNWTWDGTYSFTKD